MRLRHVVLAVIAVLTGLTACNKKDKEVTPEGYFSFKLDNVEYKSNSTQGYITDTIIKGKKTLIVDGVTNNFGKHMELLVTFPDGVKAGQYAENIEMSLMDIQQKEPGYFGRAVTVKISSINSKDAEGTFSGTLTSGEIEKPLTDGTFKVNF
ncbi:hypothetical protein [Chitinophaga solisilvae]|uniref:Uncharacterized protein n=1 Tax=Chitinophaga solisilvae TaxID=1233460 RepID=A0A433WNK4_9BACT|nr:hypothetical protein [Chitinophaga solisilvae]NSL89057.1 hypothetical protein [Chitinophaga solisilvae]